MQTKHDERRDKALPARIALAFGVAVCLTILVGSWEFLTLLIEDPSIVTEDPGAVPGVVGLVAVLSLGVWLCVLFVRGLGRRAPEK